MASSENDPCLCFADMFWSAMKILVCEERLDALHTDVTGDEGQFLGLLPRLAEIQKEAADGYFTVDDARQVFMESYRRFFQPVDDRFARCGQHAQEQSQDFVNGAYGVFEKKVDEVRAEIREDLVKFEEKIYACEQRARSNKRKIGVMNENYFALDRRMDELVEEVRMLQEVKKDKEERFDKAKVNFLRYAGAQVKDQGALLACYEAFDA